MSSYSGISVFSSDFDRSVGLRSQAVIILMQTASFIEMGKFIWYNIFISYYNTEVNYGF